MIREWLDKLGVGRTNEAEATAVEASAARAYVDALPDYMLRHSLQALCIDLARPLPLDDDMHVHVSDRPSHEEVVNCLKLKCGFDPVVFSEARQARFMVERKTCALTVDVQFTAEPQRPCSLSLTVRRRRV